MRYLIRINMKAFNPLTMKMDPRFFWEIEQCSTKDSDKVLWHCAKIRIRHQGFGNETAIEDYLAKATAERKAEKAAKKPSEKKEKAKPIEFEFRGICVRGPDDAIVIQEGR